MGVFSSYLKSTAFSVLLFLAFASFLHATTTPDMASLNTAIRCLCGQLTSLMPAICLLLIMGAGVVYAAGQVGGAELRSKAQGYATAMVMGAVIGLIMSILLPNFITTIYTQYQGVNFCSDLCCSGACP